MAGLNDQDLPFLIVGGGIGGLVTAYALALKGFPVRVLEQSDDFREIGAGIQLGPNIFMALDKIGLKDAILADAWVPPHQEMRDALTGKLITEVPLNEEFIRRFKQPYAVTHRHDIHATFLKACQGSGLITLETSREVADFEDDGKTATAVLKNGGRIKGRALIGCDGLWSKIRGRVVGDGKPRVSGHIAYRAVLKKEDVPADLWQPGVILWAGPRTHFVHYPLRRGELYNLVAVFHSDHYSEGWDSEGDKQLLFDHFKGQRPEVLRMLERIETWRYWVLCDREPIKNWSKGRVTLLGDAAHPMLQYLAQGACQATEDAVWLAEKVAEQPDDLPAAFQAYQQQRYLRTARVQIMARIYGEFYHARGPAAELRDMMLSARTPSQSFDGIAWLYGSM
ncbi:3-hydroxybenzoate 6-monooxygenase [Pseudorhodoplanes sinuspersici]|uniref:Salicylate hydroxylase n=1 Tax=Pseudorhodoplanes sinuspersici TaxID=1235591 RepID=A0A1W6ZVW0_9HYPH|nr:3-hydroxybenzoate 6-monooxygenase [Pseudorhodoplanes sinuspersici]ARQ01527.1 salicylate hydroxylase [Pseudorhodoplanes sinuspersici]RKE73230.1 3-hydroxybenzoate 6-hydroxylase [Pseudorhodoplanes sinuspersici]